MVQTLVQSNLPIDVNGRALGRYLVFGAGLLITALLWAIFNLPARYLYLVAAAPIAFAVVISPRVALYQFVVLLFFEHLLIQSIPLYLIDLSSILVVVAGAFDFFLRGRWPRRVPKLALNYAYMTLALVVCGLASFWPEIAFRRVLTSGWLVVLFVAVFRLTARVGVLEMLKLFTVTAATYSAYVLVPFITSGGVYRSLGFQGVLFDDYAMVALPIATALFLTAPKRTVGIYLIGAVVILGGVVATQSRAPIVMSLVATLFVILVARNRKMSSGGDQAVVQRTRPRAFFLLGSAVAGVVLVLALNPQIFIAVAARFEELLSFDPQGTTVYRLALWKRAIGTFLDYPIFGVGPGGFYRLNEIYASWHIQPNYHYLRALGVHNVLLHVLADTGLIGGLGLLALVANQFRIGRKNWRQARLADSSASLALFGWAFLFGLTTLIEANWMWGQLSFMAVFLAALVSRHYCDLRLDQRKPTASRP